MLEKFVWVLLSWISLSELADKVFQRKGAWSIENPASSMLWLMPQVLLFIAQHPHVRSQLDMCQFGKESKKPTVFLASGAFLAQIVRQCSGETVDHVHVPLKGTVSINGKETFRTKLAQVYPHELCELYASRCESLFTAPVPAVLSPPTGLSVCSQDDPLGLLPCSENGSQFSGTFAMITPAYERKRVLGQPCRFREHGQAGSARNVLNADYQMRRGLVPPLFDKEMEPGHSVKAALISFILSPASSN